MAGVNVGGGSRGGRRALDTEINMVPMIDLLMVTISFLLITAVWVESSRMEASANAPGSASETPPCTGVEGAPCKPEARLHVQTTAAGTFLLAWKEGAVTVRSAEVSREPARTSYGKEGKVVISFPALAARVSEEWNASGVHRDPSDKRFDQAVVHAGNEVPYAELVAIMDAVSQPKRVVATGGATSGASAFAMTLATD